MSMVVKRYKPKYIRKYDYLRSFYMPKDEWFLSTVDLNKCLEERMHSKIADVDEEDDNFAEGVEIDSYSNYKEALEEGLEETIEETDPRIFEGKIIDEESKKFIKETYNLPAQDLSRVEIANKDKAFELTKKYLKENNIILFQPTFIYNGLVTNPDAIVIKDGVATLIEVKGTSNPKTCHIFDLYFQYNVVSPTIELSQCLLCIVKYETQSLKKVSFVLIERGSFSKTGFSTPNECKGDPFDPEIIKKKALLRECKLPGPYNCEAFNYINLFKNNPFSDKFIEEHFGNKYAKGVSLVKKEVDSEMFAKRINSLKEYPLPEESTLPSFIPCLQYKSDLKDAEHWKQVRELWFDTPYYYGTQFSGNLIGFDDGIKLNAMSFNSLNDFIESCRSYIKEPKNPLLSYIEFLEAGKSEIYSCNIAAVKKFLDENFIFKKKVYFDFESLNTAVRAVDGYLPFMQTVNQVSVCYDLDGDEDIKQAESIVIDPLNGITKEDFKKIVDRILPPTKKETLKEKLEYWAKFNYVVYNKGFEQSRLTEIASFLNDPEYKEKIKVINDHIVDLADLFTIRKSTSYSMFIVFKELKGFYSIKKVLPLVMKYDREAFDRAGCKDYHTLDVMNGTMAQSLSTRRFFNKIDSDEDWEKHVNELKVYCDNDVRAMVAVEYFVRDLIEGKLDL